MSDHGGGDHHLEHIALEKALVVPALERRISILERWQQHLNQWETDKLVETARRNMDAEDMKSSIRALEARWEAREEAARAKREAADRKSAQASTWLDLARPWMDRLAAAAAGALSLWAAQCAGD